MQWFLMIYISYHILHTYKKNLGVYITMPVLKLEYFDRCKNVSQLIWITDRHYKIIVAVREKNLSGDEPRTLALPVMWSSYWATPRSISQLQSQYTNYKVNIPTTKYGNTIFIRISQIIHKLFI